jgi:hypothetical protein
VVLKKINRLTIIAICFFRMYSSEAQQLSPFNKQAIKDSSSSYSFIVTGHMHGSSNNLSTFPASTILANIDTINSLRPAFIMNLGDLFIQLDKTSVGHYEKSLFNKLTAPLFNSPGNHDFSHELSYNDLYGKSYFSFNLQSERFIILDTEKDNGNISGGQMDLLKEAISATSLKGVKNIFIFSHRPVWTDASPLYSDLFDGNTRSVLETNFSKDIVPLLSQVPDSIHVFWLSGSLGGMAPASFFYHHNKELRTVFIQTAIRDVPRDAILEVNADRGAVSFNTISLTGEKLEKLEYYGPEIWKKKEVKAEFNFRMIPYLALQMIHYPAFWYGFVTAAVLVLLCLFVYRRLKRRRNRS